MYLELSANVDDDVCPGVDVVYNCTTDAPDIEWTALPYFTRFPRVQFSQAGSDNSGPITITPVSDTPFTTTLTIAYSDVLNSTDVSCTARNNLGMSITYRRLLGK